MSETVFQPLVVLQRKPNPDEFKGVQINFINADVTAKRKPAVIQDKRKTSTIDRAVILDKLRKNDALFVKVETEKMKQALPLPLPLSDTREKLVIPEKSVKKLVLKTEEEIPVIDTEEEDTKALEEVEKMLEAREPILLTEEVEEKMVEQPVKDTAKVTEPPAKRGRKKKLILGEPTETDPSTIDITKVAIRNQNVGERLPKEREKIVIKAPSYYMNNRKIFVQKLAELFQPYRKEYMESMKQPAGQTLTKREEAEEFKMLMHQKLVRDYLNLYSPYRGLLVYHGLGAGKCMAKDTPILMYDGTIKMVQDIQVGDLLLGDNSGPRTVLSLARGRDKMYDIVPVKGDKYTVNQEHILCLRASGFPKFSCNASARVHNYNIQWIENNTFMSKSFSFTDENREEKKQLAHQFFKTIQQNSGTSDNVLEIEVKEYVKLPQKTKAALKGYRTGVDFPEKELPIDPYMIGYWLGDGTSCRAEITCQDSTVLYYFAKQLPQYNLGLTYRGGYTYYIGGNGKPNKNVFSDVLKDLCMMNDKHIPHLYKCNSRENRLKLLAGLIDSDGCAGHGGFEFTNKNERLMDDVIYVARSLGFACYKSSKKTSWTYNGIKKQGTAWRIHINGEGIEQIPTKIPRKQAEPRKQIKNALVTGIKAIDVGEGDYYGFMLDGNCRYLIGDFTVTHNTCTSIAMAEGMKSEKKIYVLTPASLKMNFFSEMKKCGDDLYRKNQYWEFVGIDGNPEYVPILARALSLTTEYIRNHGGAWLVNVQKKANFEDLKTEHQRDIDEQLNAMIRTKYVDINYNGLNMNKMRLLTGDFQHNPFDNAVVIVDEAHNLVSRIVNKINSPSSISYMLYDYLMKAENARVIALSGTPIINYPNEIGVLFNMLRGYIKTWTMTVSVKTSNKINTETILGILEKENMKIYDYVEYSGNKLTITRNPYGFVNVKKRGVAKGTKRQKPLTGGKKTRKHRGLQLDEYIQGAETDPQDPQNTFEHDADAERAYRIGYNQEFHPHKGGAADYMENYNGIKRNDAGEMSDNDFLDMILRILQKHGIEVTKSTIQLTYNKALPDDSDAFLKTFVNGDSGESQNLNLFQRRILGLSSYFRSPQEDLLPRFELTDDGDKYHIEKCEMTLHQFGLYEKIRKVEADKEKSSKKRKAMKDPAKELFTIASTYRIFSRAVCNFAFPPAIERPVPDKMTEDSDDDVDESEFDLVAKPTDMGESTPVDNTTYAKRIEKALSDVNTPEYLSKSNLGMFSPKFLRLLENLTDPENKGLHLIYSHFRTIEGIGIMRLILLMNGYAEFKLKKSGDTWELVEEEADAEKPKFVLYTGTETAEEKEIIRNIYNGSWDIVPSNLSSILKQRAENNNLGEIIKVFMITASGAEGINLRNTRFVHVMESYWHNVRLEQVVGRARRINSHKDLPLELRTVKVFLYLATLSQEQKVDDKHIELRIRDVSRIDKKTPITTDEYLFEIASLKQRINNQILQAIKETAVDCNVYNAVPKPKGSEDHYVCYGEGRVESNQFSSYPSFDRDQERKTGLDIKATTWEARKIAIGKKEYALNEKTMELYDYTSFIEAQQTGSQPLLVGRLVNENGKYKVVTA
uniref:DOD-type homing endonuclease domain-containing protein n=1 Tax=viral metagenome TaxID=1070528 RepID=A0A6C0DN40_9ZZZZ